MTAAIFGRNLKQALARLGIKQKALASGIHKSKDDISKWCRGKAFPHAETRLAIADFLGVPLSDLEIGSSHPRSGGRESGQVRPFERGYRKVARDERPKDWRGHWVPLIAHVAAGQGASTLEAEDLAPGDAEWWVEFHSDKPNIVAVEISGESMMPEYRPGDIVIADPDQVSSGGICVVVWEDDAGEWWSR